LFGSEGVDIITDYLRMDLRLLSSGLGHHRLLLCAIQCTWYVFSIADIFMQIVNYISPSFVILCVQKLGHGNGKCSKTHIMFCIDELMLVMSIVHDGHC